MLRLGAYQILYMDSVPSYAAVSQSVSQARAVAGSGAASVANAVLRALEREGEDRGQFPDPVEDPLGHLSTWGSHPRWLVRRWLSRWSVEEVTGLIEHNNRAPPLTVAPVGASPQEAVDELARGGVEASVVPHPFGCVEILDGTPPQRVLQLLPCQVQDPAAALVVAYADPPASGLRADLCAAPGGKAVSLARDGAFVVAADASLLRLRLLAQSFERLGLRAGLVVARAEEPPIVESPFVLLDVPCTGTGTLRRRPDARWRLTPEDLRELSAVQRRILEAAQRLVPRRGLLVYATCSLETEENQGQVEAFLRARPEFRVEVSGTVEETLLDGAGRLVVLPHVSGCDGVFAARLRRVV